MKLREIFNRQLNEATLRRGSRGDEVKALQRALGITPADGIFGPQTEKAVRTFQTNAGLTVDGLAGGQTQAAVRRYAEEPDASSDFGNVRPGSDWSDLDPGDIEVTPAAEPEAEPATPGDAADDGGLGQRSAPDADAEEPGDAADDGGLSYNAQPGDPNYTGPGLAATGNPGAPTSDQLNQTQQARLDRGAKIRINGVEYTQADIDAADQAQAASRGPTTRPNNRPADPVSFNSIAAALIGRDQVKDGDTVIIDGQEATVASTEGGQKYYVDGNGNPITDPNDEEAKQATEEFVKAQVAELLRSRPNMPEDQLIRKITNDAVEQGLNGDWADRDAMAAYIAGLVPTIDRAAPDVTTDVGDNFGGGGDGADNSGGVPSAADGEVDTDAPGGITTPQPDAAPDATAAAAQQISKFQRAYGSGTDGQLPTLFRDRFLNPAMETLSLKTMKELSDELAGEIPQAPARMIVQRLENAHGNMQELQQAAQEMRGDTDPEIQDQVAALDLLIPLMTKLTRDAARNESVELNRIKMLAGM